MQEFRIQTSSFAPEYGRTPGAQISIVTKGGGNGFHGAAFDYLRNDIFDARNWFNTIPQPKPPLRQNDFGGTLGGPIRRNRTFFFMSYEGLRLREPRTSERNFPTAQTRAQAAPVYRPFLNAYPLPNGPVTRTGSPGGSTSRIPIRGAWMPPEFCSVIENTVRRDVTPALPHSLAQPVWRGRQQRHDDTVGSRSLVLRVEDALKFLECLLQNSRRLPFHLEELRPPERQQHTHKSPLDHAVKIALPGRPQNGGDRLIHRCGSLRRRLRLRLLLYSFFRYASSGAPPEQQTQRRQAGSGRGS